MTQQPVALITAGGTGGHVFPALAVAKELAARGYQIEWMGAPRGIENELVPANDIPLHLISVAGLRGNGIKRLLLAPVMLVKAFWQAMVLVKKIRPNVVLGMGGFAAGPGCLAAKCLRVPVVVHEQNAIPGLTNNILARVANKVLEGFEGAFLQKGFANAVYTGNPVRQEISLLQNRQKQEDSLHILIVGGSLGAEVLNDVVPKALALLDIDTSLKIRHQCGRGRQAKVAEHYRNYGVEARVSDFVDDMAEAYCWADLVICRAGAMTVAEVAAMGLPAIFVPYPYAVDDHQTENALSLVRKKAAELIDQDSLTPKKLGESLQALLDNTDKLKAMALASSQSGKKNATDEVATICEEVSRG